MIKNYYQFNLINSVFEKEKLNNTVEDNQTTIKEDCTWIKETSLDKQDQPIYKIKDL